MPDKYEPSFTMTEEMTNKVIEIGELVGKISSHESLSMNPKLRRESRIKSIHSSLAIENNTLTLEQTTAVIEGKRVLAPPQDIKEVQNAYEAYEHCLEYDPYSIENLLTAHKYMMNDLVKEAGMFRTKNVGVYSGDVLIHAGTPANYVAELMQQLFVWLRESKLHPLVKSCIFHYEFEFIHPFNDGNGRTGRLWQSLILQKWQPLFAWLPVETMIHDNQQAYYDAIGLSNKEGTSDKFVEFMLGIIKSTLEEIVENQSGQDVGINVGINVGIKTADKVIKLLEQEPKLSAVKIAEILGITSRQAERVLADLKSCGRIERIGSNKTGYWKINNES